jgi:phosphonate transport system substrate-binding protein
MPSETPFVLGAVAYDPKVVTIWEGFRDWFADQGFAFDYVLYSNYERQAEAHLAGHVHVTWDSPLAWVRHRRLAEAAGRTARAIAMRDTDQDLTSVVLVRANSAHTVPADLEGTTVGAGAVDSPQATLLPLAHLAGLGLDLVADLDVRRYEVGVGKHGDHVGGERDAVKALLAGEVDAACVLDGNQLTFAKEGLVDAGALRVLARTAPFDHCTMTVLDGDTPASTVDRFVELLLGMSFEDPVVRPLLELEGLKEWRPGRTSGYRQLEAAVDRLGFYGPDGRITASGYAP